MENLRRWLTGEKERPLYPFEVDQDLRFGGRNFQPCRGSVAFLGGRYTAMATAKVFQKLGVLFTVGPEEITDAETLQRLVSEDGLGVLRKGLFFIPYDAETFQKGLRKFGISYVIFPNDDGPADYATAVFQEEDGETAVRSGSEMGFDMEAVLRSFTPYGFHKPRKASRERGEFLPGEIFLPAPEGRT